MEKEAKLIIVMVGIPARGKSYICRKIARFLNWIGVNSMIFNQSIYRKQVFGEKFDKDYYDQFHQSERDRITSFALDQVIDYLENDNGQVALLDGTNTRLSRRNSIKERLAKDLHIPYKIIFLEAICTLESLIEHYIYLTAMSSPDFKNFNKEEAASNLRERIEKFNNIYEPLSSDLDGKETCFIKLINQGSEINTRNLKGYMESKILSYVMNLHTGARPIYFSRHGESMYNVKHLIGGDSKLSPLGEKYGQKLAEFFKKEQENYFRNYDNVKIYCSTMIRTIQTAANLEFLGKPKSLKNLDEINSGIFDGFTYKEIEQKFPQDFLDRANDKLRYRYPRGESYLDMIHRIQLVIYELERLNSPVIVVGHQGIIRGLYGYFASIPIEKIPMLEIPLHTVIKFIPHAYGFTEERFVIDPDTGDVTKQVRLTKAESKDDLIDRGKKRNSNINLTNIDSIKGEYEKSPEIVKNIYETDNN